MVRLMRRAVVMGVLAAAAYGIGACSERGEPSDQQQPRTPIQEQTRPPADPGARPDTTGDTDERLNSPVSPAAGGEQPEGSGGSGMPATTGPGTSLSRTDGGTGETGRRLDAGMGRGTAVPAPAPDAGAR
ncbi:MAG TPA: hypothetical protein VFO83_00560 [Aggregicoccus sp.]|nr:hypothetical protein [Aggregicoccus sp.]